ncbi:MAG: hypothetical protein GX557_04700 [Chloroflexi bacterium]|nr:hypothetical protein [Chloroflexota bacterium]
MRWARLPMALLAVLAVCLAHRVVRACAGELAGYAWLLLCIANGYLRLHLVRAMCEAPLVACCVLGLWVMSRTLTRFRSATAAPLWRALAATAVFGVITGLATSSKLNGLALLGPGGLMIVVVTVLLRPRLRRPIVFFIAAVLVLLGATALTVLALNPYLWPAPLAHFAELYRMRLHTMSEQISSATKAAIGTLQRRMIVVPRKVLQISASISDSNTAPTTFYVNALLLAVGLFWLIRQALGVMRRQPWNPAALAILLVGGIVSFPALLTPLDWERYYVLPVFFSTMAIAIALAWLAQRVLASTDSVSSSRE